MPIEYLALAFEMPFKFLLGELRQFLFYAALLSFCIVFAGEHMLVSCYLGIRYNTRRNCFSYSSSFIENQLKRSEDPEPFF